MNFFPFLHRPHTRQSRMRKTRGKYKFNLKPYHTSCIIQRHNTICGENANADPKSSARTRRISYHSNATHFSNRLHLPPPSPCSVRILSRFHFLKLLKLTSYDVNNLIIHFPALRNCLDRSYRGGLNSHILCTGL